MGQQPNVPIEISDLPRPRAKPSPARRWAPARPGDLASPEEVPWGGAFGTTGPDTGYAAKLLAERGFHPPDGEDHHNAEAAVVAIAGARASRLGRAPIAADVDVALLLLGYDDDGVADEVRERLDQDRPRWLANLGHDPAAGRALVASIAVDVLELGPEEIRARLGLGEDLIGR